MRDKEAGEGSARRKREEEAAEKRRAAPTAQKGSTAELRTAETRANKAPAGTRHQGAQATEARDAARDTSNHRGKPAREIKGGAQGGSLEREVKEGGQREVKGRSRKEVKRRSNGGQGGRSKGGQGGR